MLTIRLESTLDDSYDGYYNKLFIFDSDNGSLKTYTREPFMINADMSYADILNLFNIKLELYKPYKFIINKKVKDSYSFPFKIYIDVTDKCQLNCEHCLTKKLNLNNELSFEKIEGIINECDLHGAFYVKIGGGEPLMHPNIFEIIKKFHDVGMFVSMSTNGILINETVAKFLSKYNVKVSISLEGPRYINDIIRGKGHFDIALNALKILKDNGCNVILRVTLTRYMINKDNIIEMIELAKEYGVKLKISYCRPAGNAIDNHLLINYEDYYNYNQIIELINRDEYKDLILMDEGMQINQDSTLNDMLYNQRICGAANRSFHINSEGKLSPCVFLGEQFVEKDSNYSYGDILKYWQEKIGQKVRNVRNINMPILCGKCSRLCKYECLATRLYFNDGYEKSDPNCLKEVKRKCLKLK